MNINKGSSGKIRRRKSRSKKISASHGKGKDEKPLRAQKVSSVAISKGVGPITTGDHPLEHNIRLPKVPVYNKRFFKSARSEKWT